jgi:hypothetical protein
MIRRIFLQQIALPATLMTSDSIGARRGEEQRQGLATDAEAALHRDELAG